MERTILRQIFCSVEHFLIIHEMYHLSVLSSDRYNSQAWVKQIISALRISRLQYDYSRLMIINERGTRNISQVYSGLVWKCYEITRVIHMCQHRISILAGLLCKVPLPFANPTAICHFKVRMEGLRRLLETIFTNTKTSKLLFKKVLVLFSNVWPTKYQWIWLVMICQRQIT